MARGANNAARREHFDVAILQRPNIAQHCVVASLIDQNVVALVGYRGTANLRKIMPRAQSAGIAQVGNTAGARSLRDTYMPNICHRRASTADEVEAAVAHAWTVGVTRIGAAYQDDAYGKEALEALAGSLKKRGGTPASPG